MIAEEREAECARIFERLGAERGLDLEAQEFFVRGEVLKLGARVLEKFLDWRLQNEPAPACQNQHRALTMHSDGKRSKGLRTILGEVTLRRTRWVCPLCGAVRYAADAALDAAGTGFSPGLRRLMADRGAKEPFGEGAQTLGLHAAVRVDAKDIERVAEATGRQAEAWMQEQGAAALALAGCGRPTVAQSPQTLYIEYDGTGNPMRREELEGVAGKAPDGKAKTREAKIGCVFTQTTLDKEGRPVRDQASTSYVAAIENSTDFGHRIRQEAVRRGLPQAGRVVVLCDDQAYNRTIRDEHFAQALRIVDHYHACEHLAAFVREVARRPLDGPDHQRCYQALDEGRIEDLLEDLAKMLPRVGPRRKKGLREMAYFRRNAEAMRYGQFRRQGLFIGSGVVESSCRTIVGKRLKQPGMFWSLPGANAILALRCCILSHRFEDFWEQRAA